MSGLTTGFNSEAFMNRLFRKADGVVWDLMTGKIGIKTADGISTLEGEGDAAQITTNMMEQFGMSIPAFAQSTPPEGVKLGDMILQKNDKPAWIIGRRETEDKTHAAQIAAGTATAPVRTVISFELMRADGTRTTWRPPKVQMLGFDAGGVMVVRSLMTMLPGGATGLGQMQGMLMPLMMSGMLGGEEGVFDMEQMIPMMLMSQTGAFGGAPGADPASPAAGMVGMQSMFQTMMLAKMMERMAGVTKRPTQNTTNLFNRK